MDIMNGHYTLLKKIGKSSYGEVYLGKDNKLDRKVAVKVLKKNPDRNIGNEEILNFLKQTKTVAQHSHSGLVTIYDIVAPNQQQRISAIVMEYLEGKDLARFSISEILTPAFFLNVLEQAGTCLCFLHSKGVIHGNIRPGNIFILADRKVKLLDFGGDAIATLTFAPPELMSSSFSDEKSDIYSLGLSLIVAINNKDPFQATSTNEVSVNIQFNEPRIEASLERKLPKELCELLYQMIEKSPKKRPKDMQEVVARAQEILSSAAPEILQKSFSNQLLIGTINNDLSDFVPADQRDAGVKIPRTEQEEGAPRRNVLLLTAANTLNVAKDLLLQTKPSHKKSLKKRQRPQRRSLNLDSDLEETYGPAIKSNSTLKFFLVIIPLIIGAVTFYKIKQKNRSLIQTETHLTIDIEQVKNPEFRNVADSLSQGNFPPETLRRFISIDERLEEFRNRPAFRILMNKNLAGLERAAAMGDQVKINQIFDQVEGRLNSAPAKGLNKRPFKNFRQ